MYLKKEENEKGGKEKMNFRKLRRNVKAISPVISVLLMIAVAVAASLVTYAWVMGYLSFTTTKVGKAIAIQSVARDGSNIVTVYVQNVGDSTVQLSNVYANGLQNTPTTVVPAFGADLTKSSTATIVLNGAYPGNTLTIKVTTEDGTFTEYTKRFP